MGSSIGSLQAALDAANQEKTETKESKPKKNLTPKRVVPKVVASPKKRAKTREGTALIQGHFPKAVLKQLKLLAIEEEKTQQQLLGEALNLLFVKKGKKNLVDV